MAILTIHQLSFQYPADSDQALNNIRIDVEEGEFIVICGPSGSGKSTLLRHLKPELAPTGERTGDVLFMGRSLYNDANSSEGWKIGMVLQDPESQIVTDKVQSELVFGLESHGIEPSEMRQRVAEIVHFFGLEDWLNLATHELSGGQKQLLNLASVLALQPEVLLLDEPTAQLDPIASKQFLQWLKRINEEFGMTIVMCEHQLEDSIPIADRVWMMQSGQIVLSDKPRAWLSRLNELSGQSQPELGLYMPVPSRLYYLLGQPGDEDDVAPPLTVKEGKDWFAKLPNKAAVSATEASARVDESDAAYGTRGSSSPLISCRGVSYKYTKEGPWVLQQLDFRLEERDFVCLLGANGSGKSTLLQVMAGLRKPVSGKIRFMNENMYRMHEKELYRRVGYLAQNPLLHFVHDTVEEEVKDAAVRAGRSDPQRSAEDWIEFFELQSLRMQHPYDLSGGERQKAALAALMVSKPDVLLLDEPTKGLDPVFKQQLGLKLQQLNRAGTTIVMVTHDVEFAAQYAARCLLMFAGEITSEGTPAAFFSSHYFYTTAVNRIVHSYLPQVVTVKDVLDGCG